MSKISIPSAESVSQRIKDLEAKASKKGLKGQAWIEADRNQKLKSAYVNLLGVPNADGYIPSATLAIYEQSVEASGGKEFPEIREKLESKLDKIQHLESMALAGHGQVEISRAKARELSAIQRQNLVSKNMGDAGFSLPIVAIANNRKEQRALNGLEKHLATTLFIKSKDSRDGDTVTAHDRNDNQVMVAFVKEGRSVKAQVQGAEESPEF